jgi:tartrate dehydratase beta subunit/fumarate hydratase class I family protein
MTSETITDLAPDDVLDLAREFFTGRDAVHEASVSEESDTHITFATFRSRIVVAAFPDPDGEDETRVRVSTLREYDVADQFLTFVRTAPRAAPRSG